MSPKRRRSREAPVDAGDEALSAAERMALFKAAMRREKTHRAEYVRGLSFLPDAFQIEAMDALEGGENVLVAAPTGAGKTVIGEFATSLALSKGRRSFYTTPIKALSNQKFAELSERFGPEGVGLLTGDASINPGAPVVVMTTEVLRNMIYAGADLGDVDSVVLDEVHYLADRFRGPVWEEVIIHLPRSARVAALSATVSNAEEFGAWIHEVRGGCRVIVSEVRPVPLYQHMVVGRTIYDLYAPGHRPEEGRLNPELLAAVSNPSGYEGGRGSRNWRLPRSRAPRESRPSTLISLDRAGLLPAITFIFSRAGCEAAVDQVLGAGIALTSPEEARRIRREIESVTAAISPEDFAVLGVSHWAEGLERGVAAHHAGMLPLMKEAVERLFARGLIKMVYATETLALGINMPARSVVIESLMKWNGAEHVRLSPGEYTQLSGRAGRRGIDTEGHALVLHRASVAPEEVASLASKRTYPLISAFTPRYNMVVNLLDHSTRAKTRSVLETSFAQFQADGSLVRLAARVKELQSEKDALREAMRCDLGDAGEYFRLRDELSLAQKAAARERRSATRVAQSDLLASLGPGDVIAYGRGRRSLYAVVAFQSQTAIGRVSTTVIGTDGKFHTLGPQDCATDLRKAGRMGIAGGSALRRNKERTRIAEELRRLVRSGRLVEARPVVASAQALDLGALEAALRSHGVHRCPKREEHAKAGYRWARLDREEKALEERIDARTHSVAKRFDKVCAILEGLGFIDGDRVTDRGQRLRRIFGERDLIVMEALSSRAWEGLSDPELAAIASTCVFESRSENGPAGPPEHLPPSLSRAWEATIRAAERVRDAEEAAGLEASALPDPGLMGPCLAWANGASLSTALLEEEMQGGDFVRWIRQVVDLLDQLRGLDDPGLAAGARRAKDLLVRGVVSWSAP